MKHASKGSTVVVKQRADVSKTGVSVVPQKDWCPPKKSWKSEIKIFHTWLPQRNFSWHSWPGIAHSVECSSARSQLRAPAMPACRYIEENSLAVILATKKSAGVSIKHKSGCPLWLWNPEETSPEVQNNSISGQTKDLSPPKIFWKNSSDFSAKSAEKSRKIHIINLKMFQLLGPLVGWGQTPNLHRTMYICKLIQKNT